MADDELTFQERRMLALARATRYNPRRRSVVSRE